MLMLRPFIAPALAGLLFLPAAAVAQTAPQPQQQEQRDQDQQRDQQRTQDQQRQDQQRTQDQQRQDQQRAGQQHDQQRATDQRRDGDLVLRADRLIGQRVYARGEERVGRIDDLALNVNNNRIEHVVVSRGGVFGLGAEQVAVRWNQIQPDRQERVVRFQGTEAELQQARRIDAGAGWPMGTTGDRDADRPVGTAGEDRRDDQRTQDRQADQQQRDQQARQQGQQRDQARQQDQQRDFEGLGRNMVSVSRIIGTDVRNQQGERLGQIEDITLKQDGSINYAVITHGGFLGMGGNQVAVPWDRLQVNAQQERIVLNVSRQQLEQAPRFEARDGMWPGNVNWPFGDGR
jgi:sporulation protein YlmC with PRC-barrel domain